MPKLHFARMTRAALLSMVAVCSGATFAALAGGCGSDTTNDPGDGTFDGGTDAPTTPEPVVTTLFPDAPPLSGFTECKVETVTGIAIPGAVHLDYCTEVDYATNPPSGGDHWGMWAPFTRFETPVPREVYVHDMEHGAVILTYRCDGLEDEECTDVKAAVDEVFSTVAIDPLCVTQPAVARVLMTPDPEIPTPIAASAWGATYTATCIDEPSLKAFVKAVYGKGTEKTCATGQYSDGAIVCSDGGLVSDAGGGGGHP